MSSVIGSTGKFGTSMDCSQRLDILRRSKIVGRMHNDNPYNRVTIKPHFNQDNKNSASDNGSSDFYSQRGLYSVVTVKRYGF
jgi:hypothetical protein